MIRHEWKTEYNLKDNEEVLEDYLKNQMPKEWKVISVEGTYAEVCDDTNLKYSIQAGHVQNGFKNHKVELFLCGNCSL